MRHIGMRGDGTLIRLVRPRRILLTTALELALTGGLAMTVRSTHAAGRDGSRGR
jgi:hypothetical protein